jgi:hypothetical protein
MNRLETLIVVGALGAGSILGFAGARWGTPGPREGGVAASMEAALGQGANESGTAEGGLVGANPLEAIREEPVRSRRMVLLDRYCEGLDVAGVQRALLTVPENGARRSREVRDRLMGRWAELDPAGAAAYAMGKRDRETRLSALQTVLGVWLEHDAEAAKKFVAEIKDPDMLRGGGLHFFVVDLAHRDFAEAMKFAEAVPKAQKQTVIWAAFRAAGHLNPSTAMARALATKDEEDREQAVASAISMWTVDDAPTAVAWAREQPGVFRRGESLYKTALNRWAFADPPAAAAFFAKQPLPGAMGDQLTNNIASNWAYCDPEAALAWVEELSESKAKTAAIGTVVGQWAARDPEAAAAYAMEQPAGPASDEMLASIGRSWSMRNPAAAAEWAMAQEDPGVEKAMLPVALGAMAMDDPSKAVQMLAQVQEADARAAAIRAIARNWAASDPQAAVRWILALPETDARKGAVQDVVSSAAGRNPTATAQWLESFKDSPLRDTAVAAFAERAQYHDSVSAATWANTIADAEQRRTTVRDIVHGFANHDLAGARRWVMGQNFDETERQALLKQIEEASKRK